MWFDDSIEIRASTGEVFGLLCDVQETATGAGSPVLSMAKMPPGPTRVGTRWREVIRLGPGLRMTMWSEATAVEADRLLAVRFWGGSMRGELRYTLDERAGRTVLRQQESLATVGWLTPFEGLVTAMLVPRLRRRLRDIRDLLESRGGHRTAASGRE